LGAARHEAKGWGAREASRRDKELKLEDGKASLTLGGVGECGVGEGGTKGKGSEKGGERLSGRVIVRS
jgi:hypothetical protein